LRKEENTIKVKRKRKKNNMKTFKLLVILIFLTSCSGKLDSKKLDLRKECTGNETNKTLSDLFCKKK